MDQRTQRRRHPLFGNEAGWALAWGIHPVVWAAISLVRRITHAALSSLHFSLPWETSRPITWVSSR